MIEKLIPAADPRLLVGQETMDDAAVISLRPDLALCLTADFITPVVDDAYDFGWIAANNSLSDVYAMGGKPLCALNLVCWPSGLPQEILARVLQGGADLLQACDSLLVGGHTVEDKEPKYGLAVVGTIDPRKILRNRGARPGDVLYLSKALGTGIVATAIKGDLATPEHARAALVAMKEPNREVAAAAVAAGARALTDVTGFGFMGHLAEMLDPAQNLGVQVRLAAIPLLPGALELAGLGMIPAGAYRNREAYQRLVVSRGTGAEGLEMLLYDPQTSGGLLCAVPPQACAAFEEEARRRKVATVSVGLFDSSGGIALCDER